METRAATGTATRGIVTAMFWDKATRVGGLEAALTAQRGAALPIRRGTVHTHHPCLVVSPGTSMTR